MQSFSASIEKKALQTFVLQISLHDYTEDTALAKSQVKSCCDHYEALGRSCMKVEQTRVYLSEKQTEIPLKIRHFHRLALTQRNFSSTIRNSAHLYGDCLVMVCKKDLEEREREVPGVSVQKRNSNLETAAISKNLQFELHCPFRGSLAVKWSCTSNFPSGVRMLL